MSGKKIGFTYDLRDDYLLRAGDPVDANAEFDAEETVDSIKEAIEAAGHEVIMLGNARNVLKRLPDLGVDIVFNICEGILSRNREAHVPILLEMFHIPYIGSDALTMSLTLDKAMAKKVFQADGIPTPHYLGIDSLDQLIELDHMTFPMIVKMRQEGSSMGLRDESVVHDKQELDRQARYLFERYGPQPLLLEEFIAGSEFTVPVIGNNPPEALPVVQVQIKGQADLGEMIYTYDRITSPDLKYVCPAELSPEMEKHLQGIAIKAYQAVGCLDFGRVDFRVDRNGKPYVLEINPLPSLSLEDVFDISPVAAGYDFKEAIRKIIDVALKRNNL